MPDKTELSSWIGKTQSVTETLDRRQVQLMQATMREDEHIWRDGEPMPPGWHWIFFNEARPASELGRDGHPRRGGFLPPVPLPRRMWAGGRMTFSAPLRIGAEVTKRSTILSITPKEGRSGPLCFVTVEHTFLEGDRLMLREEQDLVYREDPAPDAVKPPAKQAPGDAEISRTITPSPVLMFRYSALTFNGHRIHYDADYAREVEGYPGLVFHAPLTADLLIALAKELAEGRAISAFEFRAVSPLFGDAAFTIHARREGEGVALWAANPQGALAMEARAAF